MYTFKSAAFVVSCYEGRLKSSGEGGEIKFSIGTSMSYKKICWEGGQLDLVNVIYPQITLQFFDACIYHGLTASVKILQRAILSCQGDMPKSAKFEIDGVFGAITFASLYLLSEKSKSAELNSSFFRWRKQYLSVYYVKERGEKGQCKDLKAQAQKVYDENNKHFNLN